MTGTVFIGKNRFLVLEGSRAVPGISFSSAYGFASESPREIQRASAGARNACHPIPDAPAGIRILRGDLIRRKAPSRWLSRSRAARRRPVRHGPVTRTFQARSPRRDRVGFIRSAAGMALQRPVNKGKGYAFPAKPTRVRAISPAMCRCLKTRVLRGRNSAAAARDQGGKEAPRAGGSFRAWRGRENDHSASRNSGFLSRKPRRPHVSPSPFHPRQPDGLTGVPCPLILPGSHREE